MSDIYPIIQYSVYWRSRYILYEIHISQAIRNYNTHLMEINIIQNNYLLGILLDKKWNVMNALHHSSISICYWYGLF